MWRTTQPAGVVGEEVLELFFVLEVEQEVDDLCLHGKVEGAQRLVTDQEPRVEHQRTGDGDPLALAPREACWILVGGSRRKADPIEHLRDSGLPVRAARAYGARRVAPAACR